MQSPQAIIPKDEINNHGKRRSSSISKPDDLKRIKTVATVIYDDDHIRASDNKVHVSPKLFQELFGEDKSDERFIKIANTVFPAIIDSDLTKKTIDVTPTQYDHFKHTLGDTDEVVVRPFVSDLHTIGFLDKIHFHVEAAGEMNSSMGAKNKPSILSSSLIHLIREQVDEQILRKKQELFINHPVVGPLKLTVEGWNFLNVDEPPYYGSLTFLTEFEFSINRGENLAIVQEIDPGKLHEFTFTINKVENLSERAFTARKTLNKDSWKKGAKPLPLIVPLNEMTQALRKKLDGVPIFPEHKEDLTHSEDWLYTLELSKVTLKRGVRDEWGKNQSNIQRAFRLNDSHRVVVKPNSNVILTKSVVHARSAETVTFEVIDQDLAYTTGKNEVPWLSVQNIIDQIKSQKKTFAIGSKVVINLKQGKFLLQVKKANELHPKRKKRSNLKELWKLDDKTDVKVFPNSRLKLEIVDSPKPYKIDSMRVIVDIPGAKAQGGIFAALTGGDQKVKKEKISEEEIKMLFKQALPHDKTLIKDQTLSAITDSGKKITFTIKEINSEQRGAEKAEYKHLYEVDDDTTFTFSADKEGGLMIGKKPIEITFEGIGNKMKELGIGGMPEQFLDIITKVILSRTKYAEHAKKMGQKPPRGILLWGPPGTGKTILARKLGELLGVSEENTQLITGSNVWSKWLGDSEKKVRELFAAARADQEQYGKDSPLHLIIIDEIDAFLQSRENATQRYETSVLNTFLAEMDGISGQGEGSLDNIIVVGLTNHPDKLDSAVVRPGRLGTQIHIGMPDTKGRKEIFEIHSKKVRESGYLADDVNWDEIAKLTIGRTGAFIEGMVRVAAGYPIKRLFEQQIDIEANPDHPAAKVTMEDFKNAYLACTTREKVIKRMQKKFVASDEITVDAVREDLKKLGVAGLPKHVLEALTDMKMRQANSRFFMKNKAPPPQGLYLYGPTQTGKTKLVRAVKDLFELDGARYQYFSASDLFKLKPNVLKEKLEQMIKPAQDAAKDLKEDAPLHVVVIDDMDKLFWMDRDDKPSISVMNKFLKEIENICNGVHLPNLVVVGTGCRRYKLNDAVLSHGRFGQHVAIDYPKARGRREIFEHFLAGMDVKEGVIKELVEKTRNRSPGFIEGLVDKALLFMLRKGEKELKLAHFEGAYLMMTENEPDRSYLI